MSDFPSLDKALQTMHKVPELSTIDASEIHTGDLFKSSYVRFGINLVSSASGGNDQTVKGFRLAEKQDRYGIYTCLSYIRGRNKGRPSDISGCIMTLSGSTRCKIC